MSEREPKKELLERLCIWYLQAYTRSNGNPQIIERNLSVIRDAFNSCHDPYVWELLNSRTEEKRKG